MLNVGFIMPSSKGNYKPFRNQPLVLLYLLTILEEKFGDKVSLSLIDLRGINEESLTYHITEKDVYLYSVSTPDVIEITNIVKEIRSIYPKSIHVAGGAHITLFPKEYSNIFDSVVLGEGEVSIIEVINDILMAKMRPIYRQDNSINLDKYPIPERKWLSRKAVVDVGLLDGKYINYLSTTALFSRGCPFSCHFCANNKLTSGPVRFRSPKLIEQEIEYLKKDYGISALALKDDNSIPVNVRIARPMLEAIARTNIKWRGQSRASGVHPDMVKLAKESGCVDIALGIESASQEVLNISNKTINLDETKKYIRLLKETDIGVRLHFIIGLPGEPDNIVEQTLAFIDETEPRSVLLSYLCPLPGSEFFDNPRRFGINITTRDWSQYTLTAGRFKADEFPTLVFKYDDVTPFGKSMSKEKIFRNYTKLQNILRERGLNF